LGQTINKAKRNIFCDGKIVREKVSRKMEKRNLYNVMSSALDEYWAYTRHSKTGEDHG
jgi:hypothetical protein